IFCDISTGSNEAAQQSRKAERQAAATGLARTIAPVPHSAGGVRFGVACLLALVILRLCSRRLSADCPEPAGTVMAVPAAGPDLASLEPDRGASGNFL